MFGRSAIIVCALVAIIFVVNLLAMIFIKDEEVKDNFNRRSFIVAIVLGIMILFLG